MAKKKANSEKGHVFNIDKKENFSEWFTEIIKTAELADIRYDVKGFLVFRPWSVMAMEKMYSHYENNLQSKGHKPHFFPTVIPEENFDLEADHVEGFSPEVFWVTHGGDKPLEEKLALRPTSETAFYKMFSLWIRSYKDLSYKTYQRANVFRYETKATRPFLRSREFHWIEAHSAHENKEEAKKQVQEDMETTQEVMHDIFGLPFIFFQRPEWDKFPGAQSTFAADVLNPDGKVVQQPSTHLLGENFSKPFNVTYEDKNGEEQYCHITCYGPAISRIFASVIIVHGDNKGLRFPWKIAPKQVVITPIKINKKSLEKSQKLKERLESIGIDTTIDKDDDSTPGEKFYYWEMKGVPLRIELGPNEMEKKELTIYRRDLDKKETIKDKNMEEKIRELGEEYDKEIIKQADKLFDERIQTASNKEDIKAALDTGKIVRCGFCSLSGQGESCAAVIEKDINATVRGKNLEEEKPKKKDKTDKCIICNKKAKEIAYIAREY